MNTQDEALSVTQAMIDAYVAWDPPCQLDVSKPARALGLIRSAFMAGYKAGEARLSHSTPSDAEVRKAKARIAELEHALLTGATVSLATPSGRTGSNKDD